MRIPSWAVAAAALLLAPAACAPSATPSFLFILGDDIGWSDFSYANGTAVTPNIKAWANAAGSVLLQDFHSGGTVCSPTRATILTGRNHFRDCVNYVYGCSDMTECVPDFEFAPKRTFTLADAVRAAGRNYTSIAVAKWHLGSLYNDSEAFGGLSSSPITHGFDKMNVTVEVAPTATLNCQCSAAWDKGCNFGHYGEMTHCGGGQGPDPNAKPGCCFNYWANDATQPHGIANFTQPTPDDDSTYVADAFVRFAEAQQGAPFLAYLAFHNCHIPFVGTAARVQACNDTSQCAPPLPGAAPYNAQELDFYACLNELDGSVGVVLAALKRLGYYDNTLVALTTDNGPEVNCLPEGRCGSGSTGVIPPGTLHRPASGGAGSAGPLRGRKRDVWEGGHRVPGIVSWPAVVGDSARVSWEPLVTMDYLATVMDVLGVERPQSQRDWAFDGVSFLPMLRGEAMPERAMAWMYYSPVQSTENGYAFRWGRWKYVAGGISCNPKAATFDCAQPQLYDMVNDKEENFNLALTHPDILAAAAANFSVWYKSIHNSIANESQCATTPAPPAPFPPTPPASTACTFFPGKALNGADMALGEVASREECCGACRVTPGCVASDFVAASAQRPTWRGSAAGGTCHLKSAFSPKPEVKGENQTACHVLP